MADRNRSQRPWTDRNLDIRARLCGRERDHVGNLAPVSSKQTAKLCFARTVASLYRAGFMV